MFFSNQLLCRKGPLGQIWIVATMQSKLNRKKAEQINIEEICMQVLQPQVPLALRLTGILMGGIVLIYDRKVRLLHEDVNDFLCKIKTAIDAKTRPDKYISLPRAKLHARFEHVTITYDFDTFEDIERAMLAPGTPGQEESDAGKEEYVASAAPDPYGRLSSSGDSRDLNGGGGPDAPTPLLHQVSSDDITLEEKNVTDNLHQQYQDFGMDFPEDRIPPSDNLFMDDFFPEIQATVNISPDPLPQMPSPIHTEVHPEKRTADQSEHQDAHQPEFDRSIPPREGEQLEGLEPPELAQAAADPQNLRRRRVRDVATRKTIFDEGYLEIPGSVFGSWIHDTADIRQRNNRPPVGKDPNASRIQRHLDLPSVCLLSPPCVQGLEPFWPPQLGQIWERTVTGKFPAPTEQVIEDHREEPSVRPTTPVRVSARSSDPSHQSLETASGDNSFPGADGVNAERAGDPTEDSGHLNSDFLPADFTYAARSRVFGPNELRDYGSVEKLRTALQSPSAGSDDFWGNLFGRTPGQQQVTARSDKSRSTPGSGFSGSLPLDLERDPPTGDSGRFKRPRRSGSFRSTSPRIFDNLSPGLDGVGSNYDFFSQHRGGHATLPSRFDLMEETQRDTTQESIKVQVSSTLLQYIKDRLDNQGPWSLGFISSFELSEGLRREEAARLFYQICVLSSNHFLTVKQDIPYGDILLGRGIYL